MYARELSRTDFAQKLATFGADAPIEQLPLWQDYQGTIEGRRPWGFVALEDEGVPQALVSFLDYETHGYHYLRATHGPVWREEPTPEVEAAAIEALIDYVHAHDKRALFIRMAVTHESELCFPVLSGVPYDATVHIDLAGGSEDEILARMKPRGRRDVRKAVRESPAVCADETTEAAASFAECYEVMRETAARDDFAEAPCSDYEDMIRSLGPDHCRVFVARIEGKVASWSIVTISGSVATRYYAASSALAQRTHTTDRLVLFECCALAELGCVTYDLMGIGSDFSPTLMGLNEFKCKFSKEVVPVAPDRDIAVRPLAYKALLKVRDARQALNDWRESQRDPEPAVPRDDIVPVILGGDIGVYALGREFHEAFGVTSHALIEAPIKAIELSSIFEIETIDPMDEAAVAETICRIAAEHPEAKVVVTANTDAYIKVLERVAPQFPESVVCPMPPRDIAERVSDKIEFGKLCEEYGLDTPRAEIVELAGTEPIAPSELPFPVVAKPADSATYFHLHYEGFRKAYAIESQEELDELWARLRAAGYEGRFLVQVMIEGADTEMRCVTIYIDHRGKARMAACMQVLLQDHAPTMIGNYVALSAKPSPELWEPAAKMLADLGYRGFANFDIKHDRKTGRFVFLDCNPRAGRASYSVAAAGVNPMRVMVEDAVDGRSGGLLVADDPALYTLVAPRFILRYLRDPELVEEVERLVDSRRVFDPQRYVAERDARRAFYVEVTEANQARKFARYYPEPSDTSF